MRRQAGGWRLQAGGTARLSACVAMVAGVVLASLGSVRGEDGAAGPPERQCVLAATFSTGFPVAGRRVLDVDGDGAADLLVVGTHGEVRVWRRTAEKRIAEKPTGSLVLRKPDRSLLAVVRTGDGRRVGRAARPGERRHRRRTTSARFQIATSRSPGTRTSHHAHHGWYRG